MEYVKDRNISGYKKLDINYNICNERFSMKGNIAKKDISEIIGRGLEKNMETEHLDYKNGCNKKELYHISIRAFDNGKAFTKVISDTGNKELTDDILTGILGELEDPRLFDINEKHNS